MSFVRRNQRRANISGRSPKQLISASGIRLVAKRKGASRIAVSVIDRDGLLLVKANFSYDEWKEFVKAQ